MPDFSAEQRIPACLVNKTLIEELERYLQNRLTSLPRGYRTGDLSIKITDRTGTERLASITEFGPGQFFNGTKKIELEYHDWGPPRIQITLRFEPTREDSSIRVHYAGESSREFVAGLVTGIRQVLAQARTMNGWFQPHSLLKAFIAPLGLMVSLISLLGILFPPPSKPAWPLPAAAGAIIISAFFLVGIFKPYSSFDNSRNRTIRKVGNWLLAGLATFFLFTVLGVYLRGKWLGF